MITSLPVIPSLATTIIHYGATPYFFSFDRLAVFLFSKDPLLSVLRLPGVWLWHEQVCGVDLLSKKHIFVIMSKGFVR
jgi:hypothetical protein